MGVSGCLGKFIQSEMEGSMHAIDVIKYEYVLRRDL